MKMKRRDFLKRIGVVSVAPSILAVKEKALPFKPNEAQKRIITGFDGATKTVMIDRTIGFAAEPISKDEYGWVHIYTQGQFVCEQPNRSAKLVNVK